MHITHTQAAVQCATRNVKQRCLTSVASARRCLLKQWRELMRKRSVADQWVLSLVSTLVMYLHTHIHTYVQYSRSCKLKMVINLLPVLLLSNVFWSPTEWCWGGSSDWCGSKAQPWPTSRNPWSYLWASPPPTPGGGAVWVTGWPQGQGCHW